MAVGFLFLETFDKIDYYLRKKKPLVYPQRETSQWKFNTI